VQPVQPESESSQTPSQKRTLQIGDFGKQQQWEMALGVMRRMRQEFLRRHSNQTLPFGFG